MLDLATICKDQEAILSELRTAGAVIKDPRTNFCCPYHKETTPSAHIRQGEDNQWRFKCFVCPVSGSVFDLQAHRLNKDVAEVIKEEDQRRNPYRAGSSSARLQRPEPSDNSEHPEQSQQKPSGNGKPKQVMRFSDLDALKKTAEFRDYEALRRDFPDFEGKRKLARTFTYTNPANGNADLIALRLEGDWEEGEGKPKRKSCLQGCQVEGGFELRRPPGLAPLFNRKGIAKADTVVVCEGEPKVVALNKLGFVATCSPGGAQAASKADWSTLNGKKLVIVWRDKDAVNKAGKRPGLDYQNDVIAELNRLPNPPLIKVVDVDSIKDLPEDGSDVVDLITIMGELPEDQKRGYIQEILNEALPTGAHALLNVETNEVLLGQRNVVDWPWPILADYTEAIAAGTMTVMCGDPGASKSLFILQAFMEWHKKGIPLALLELEDISVDKETGITSPVFHLRRAAAMQAGNNMLTSLRWQKEHPEETKAALNNEFLSNFGRCLHSFPKGTQPTVDNLLAWVEQQVVKRGVRVVAIDPVTLADFGKDLHSEDSKMVRGMKSIIEGSKASLIVVTHPRPGARRKTLDDMALTRDWGRHTQTAIWYESHDTRNSKVRIKSATGPMTVEEDFNRTIWIQKARNTGFQSNKIAFMLDVASLTVKEIGEIVK